MHSIHTRLRECMETLRGTREISTLFCATRFCVMACLLGKCKEYSRPEEPGGRALTCFQQNDLIVLAQVHEASDAFGKLHHVLDGVGDVVCALLPHPLSRLQKRHRKRSSVRSKAATAGLFLSFQRRPHTLFW